MIKGNPKKPFRYENILDKIDPYYIYRFYLGEEFSTRKNISSPFRPDEDPSFRIKVGTDGSLFHKDYGDARKAGNCINFVQQLYGISYKEAIEKIENDFGIKKSGKHFERIISEFQKPENLTPKEPDVFEVVTRPFTKEELAYWKQYEITESELKANDVYSIKELYKNGQLKEDHNLRFAYHYDPFWKIYRPYVDKKWKWIWNNTPNDRMYGLENVKGRDKVIVTKSHKDYLVLSSIYPYVCGTQNESEVAINQTNLELLQKCKEVYIIFDNDAAGVRSCKFYNQYGFKYWNVPQKYYQETKSKDPSDLVKNYGLKELVKLLKDKRII
jgi:hypothetical protein